MATLTVEIDKERDLPALQALLTRMGLEFEVEEDSDNDDWGDLPEAAIEGIKAGLADVEAGRTHSHEYVMAEMKKKIAGFRQKNGR
jgi:predicted transcriptional regulator